MVLSLLNGHILYFSNIRSSAKPLQFIAIKYFCLSKKV